MRVDWTISVAQLCGEGRNNFRLLNVSKSQFLTTRKSYSLSERLLCTSCKIYLFHSIKNLELKSDSSFLARTVLKIPVKARFSAPVQTGPGAHPASCTMGTGSFPGVRNGRGCNADPSPPSSAVGRERVELYLYSPYGNVRPVQSLSACTRVHFIYSLEAMMSFKQRKKT